ncbi:MAG: IclR family transcriptional regulator [Alphaproteobacteria bacterium]|nr:IclR family transcriptional regulator [Alphaproteobacteria bacterium]
MSTKNAPPRPVPAVTRSIAILRFLGRNDTPVGVVAIARELDIIPSTCLQILRTLVTEELVSVDPATKCYALDAGMLALVRNALRQDRFAGLVQPELDRLSARFGITAIGVRVIGLQHMNVVAISHSDLAFRIHVDVGSRFPALVSATGRCLAAFGGHSDTDLKRGFKAVRWENAPDYDAWFTEVEQTRHAGFGADVGNYIRGVTIVATPVFGLDGTMTYGLAMVGLSDQMRDFGHDAIGAEVQRVAATLTENLGGKRTD